MKPIIQGNVAKNCHPEGLLKAIDKQIAYVESRRDLWA